MAVRHSRCGAAVRSLVRPWCRRRHRRQPGGVCRRRPPGQSQVHAPALCRVETKGRRQRHPHRRRRRQKSERSWRYRGVSPTLRSRLVDQTPVGSAWCARHSGCPETATRQHDLPDQARSQTTTVGYNGRGRQPFRIIFCMSSHYSCPHHMTWGEQPLTQHQKSPPQRTAWIGNM